MAKVRGIGGIFIKAKDPKGLQAWYREHLGLDLQAWGGLTFEARQGDPTVWSVFPAESDYFAPSAAPFMVNYRVDDLPAFLEGLRAQGCAVVGDMHDSEYGRFGWVLDPEGNKVELWEPPAGPAQA
jgi:predicted enzyme related to lactoylglutathione lyase